MKIYLPKHSLRLHLLTTPLIRTADPKRALHSRWPWRNHGLERLDGEGPLRMGTVYALTPLGILHRLTGLTVTTERPVDH